MAETESLRQVAQSRAPFSAWLGIVFLFALFGIIVLAVLGPAPRGDKYEQMRAKKRVDILKKVREEDAKALTTYGWIDKSKGTARVPIERAMELTVAELKQKKPAPAYPIATPQAQPPPTQASPTPAPAAAANPPAAKPQTSPTPQTTAGTPSQSPPGTPAPVPGKSP